MQKVLELYKEEGETPLETIERFKKENSEYGDPKLSVGQRKMTYAGRLDPMAEGVLLVLVGEECKNKEKYLGLDKEYEFEILWGFETDTYDILGIPSKSWLSDSQLFDEKVFLDFLRDLKGKFKQKYPPYSSKTVGGKQLFEWAREGRLDEVEIPEREVEVYEIEFLGNRKIKREELRENIIQRIKKVKPNSLKKNGRGGDFRQKEIINQWEKILKFTQARPMQDFVISKIKIKCSSGTYVRGVVNELGRKMKIGAIAFNIKRTEIF